MIWSKMGGQRTYPRYKELPYQDFCEDQRETHKRENGRCSGVLSMFLEQVCVAEISGCLVQE